MAKKIYEETDIQAIANAIRSQNDLTDLYKVSQMDNAILALRMAKDVLPQDTVSGAVASFPDGSDDYPVVELIVNIEPVQEGSGDPAPDNVRAISGWSAATVKDKDGENVEQWSVTINLGQTVYGGSLNVTTGVLTLDRMGVDLGGLTWTYRSDVLTFNSSDVNNINTSEDFIGIIAPIYKTVSSSTLFVNMNDYEIKRNAYNQTLAIKDSRYTDTTTFKTAMSGVMIVYELATPQTIQLTPTQVNTIYGDNNIFADTGDVDVTYRADVDLYIQKKINEAT